MRGVLSKPIAFCLSFIFLVFLFPWNLRAAETKPVEVAPQAIKSTVLCPQGTFIVARLKSFDSLSNAIDALKEWIHEHPSVESLMDDDDWKKVENFDLRQSAADYLELSIGKFDDYFSGPISICVSSDFNWASKNKTIPIVVEMTTRSADKAVEFLKMVEEDKDVINTYQEAEGIEHIRLKQDSKAILDKNSAKPDFKKPQGPMDVYLVASENKVLISNSLDYIVAAKKAAGDKTAGEPVFFRRASDSDVALWVDPRPFFEFVKSQAQAKAKAAEENGETPKVDPKLFDKLGMDEIEALGLTLDLTKLSLRLEVDTVPNPTGLAKIFTCAPTGLEPSPLVPSDAEEFTLSRIDIDCLWSELRRVAKIAVPATETMYQGWKKQIQETYGVDVDRQLFGAFGDRAIFYTMASNDKADSMAAFVAINDPKGLEGALDAVFGFFTQGKSMFERSEIAGTPIWRIKSEFQSSNNQSIAYAITNEWLIVSVGDPTQLQDLIEAAGNQQVTNKIFENDSVKDVLKDPSLVSFSHQPLKEMMSDIASVVIEVEKKSMKDDDEGDQPETQEENEVPQFDDVKDSVLIYTKSGPGLLETTLKIIPYEN